MQQKKNNFIIFDQSLSSIDGHSYIYIKNIFLESKKHFDSVKLFTNNNFLFLKKIFFINILMVQQILYQLHF